MPMRPVVQTHLAPEAAPYTSPLGSPRQLLLHLASGSCHPQVAAIPRRKLTYSGPPAFAHVHKGSRHSLLPDQL